MQSQLCERLVLLSPSTLFKDGEQDTFIHDSETQDIGLAIPSYTKEYENVSTKENTMADEKVEAYCVKCKEKRIMKDPTDTVTKNGRSAKTGTCPVCGTKLFRFVAG